MNLPFTNPFREPDSSANKFHPIERGSLIHSTRLRLVTLILPKPKGEDAAISPKKKKVLVKLEGNRRKPPRRGVFIPPPARDSRGMALRMALRVGKLIEAGIVEAEPRLPKQRPPVSNRQMRQEFIEASVGDANDIAQQRRDHRAKAKTGVQG